MELRIEGLSQRYPNGTQALQNGFLNISTGHVGAAGAERRREKHYHLRQPDADGYLPAATGWKVPGPSFRRGDEVPCGRPRAGTYRAGTRFGGHRVLDKDGHFLHLERRKIDQEKSQFDTIVDRRPAKAGIDPLIQRIDRNPDDKTSCRWRPHRRG